MDVRVGLWKRLSTEELMLLNCGVEKTLESPLDCKEIQPVHSKGDQSWVVFGRNDAEAETPVLWPPHAKSWLIGKDPDAERDWGQEEKGTTEGEMAGWHHQLHGCESEWTPGVGDGQGGLVCCDSWGHKDLDMTERLNWTELNGPVTAVWLPGPPPHEWECLLGVQFSQLHAGYVWRRWVIFSVHGSLNDMKPHLRSFTRDCTWEALSTSRP